MLSGGKYCGCWHVPCPDSDPYAVRLSAAGYGRFMDDDYIDARRPFFFADELGEQLAAASRFTKCHAEAELAPRGGGRTDGYGGELMDGGY